MSDDASKEELDTYKKLYREALAELINIKNLLYYLRLGDFENLVKLRNEQEELRSKLLQFRKDSGEVLTEESYTPPQVDAPPYTFPQQKT